MDNIVSVLSTLFSFDILFLMIGGVILGTIFGAVPGLTGALAIVILLPFTFSMQPEPAIALLISIYIGGISGGFISSTLIVIPGAPAAVATTL